jgi:hypothetical protein
MPGKRKVGGGSGKRTSADDASKAGKLLQNPRTPAAVKSVAASDLSQRGKAGKPKTGKAKKPKK